MNQTFVGSILALALTLSGTSVIAKMATTTLPLDPHHTSATFTVAHLTITKVSGQIPLVSSHVTVGANGIPTSAQASFDLTKIETQDAMRDKDLNSEKWFNTTSYPTLMFRSTAVTPGVGGNFTIDGMLSMHGQTHPVSLHGVYSGQAIDPYGKKHLGYSLTGTLDRTEWGVGNAPPAIVGNNIAIDIEAEAIK